jgi:hypothetical protein
MHVRFYRWKLAVISEVLTYITKDIRDVTRGIKITRKVIISNVIMMIRLIIIIIQITPILIQNFRK